MLEPLTPEDRPRLAAKVRLRLDRKTGQHMLLYPERGLVLNATATAVVKLCTGEHTIAAIISQVAVQYLQEETAVGREVLQLLKSLQERGLIVAAT